MSKLTVARPLTGVAGLFLLSACATAPMDRGGTLSSYDKLAKSDGTLTKSMLWVSKDDVLAAKTVLITPTAFSLTYKYVGFSDKQRRLVANAVDRSLCIGLSERFRIVGVNEPADLIVYTVITNAAPTDEVAAGLSKAASIVPSFLSLGFPVVVPRLPIGLGSLSIEAEARDPAGVQKAGIVWARGADSFTVSPKVSKAGDAYDLANAFGNDFAILLATGSSPFGNLPSAPSMQKINAVFGGKPKHSACAAFGKDPGFAGMVGNRIGMPPEWTDDGAKLLR